MRKLLTTAVAFILFFAAIAQDDLQLIPQVIPPGPTAAELGRYGLVPVTMHTGNTNVSIPLYEFKTKNLTVPISLSYNSNAIQIDEVASWVGMHWSLNAGGVVTRLVRDQPDRPGGMPYPENFGRYDATSVQYVQNLVETPEGEDTEPDLFSYNFMGYTGKLVFDRDGSAVTIPRNDLVFEGHMDNDYWKGFVVTTPDGVKYSFEEVELTTITGQGEGTYNIPTAWYLTKIKHPMGDSITLTYEPDNYNYPLNISSMVTLGLTVAEDCNTGNNGSPGSSPILTHLNMKGKMLSSIESSGYGTIDFQASIGRSDLEGGHKLSSMEVKNPQGYTIKSFAFDYVFSDNTGFKNPSALAYEPFLVHRMFLTGVIEKDKQTKSVKKHSFTYDDINALPARLSMARDHWGYFNGANNSSFFPKNLTLLDRFGNLAFPQFDANREPSSTFAKKGLLKKITYPTGGHSQFSYEGNTFYGTHSIPPKKKHVHLFVIGEEEQWEDIISSTTITSGMNQHITFYKTWMYKDGYTSTSGYSKVKIYDQDNKAVPYSYSIHTDEYQVILAAGKQYTFELIAEGPPPDGMWSNNTYSRLYFDYYETGPQNVTENIETGGIRIGSITNFDPVTSKDETINYLYARHDQLTQSSGKKRGSDPNYITRHTVELECQQYVNPGTGPPSCKSMLFDYVGLHSSGMNTLFRQNGNNINYEFVTIRRGMGMEAGLEEHEFIVSWDIPGSLEWGNSEIPGTPLTNTSWNNGLEKAIRYYKMDGPIPKLLKAIENEYTKDSRYHKEIPGLSFRRKYYPPCDPPSAFFTCDASNINKKNDVYTCVTNHDHFWSFYSNRTCWASGNDMQWITISYHPCYGLTAGETVSIPSNLYYVDAMEYKNISDWFYLAKQTVSTYDENGSNPVVLETKYFYDNDDHTQLSRKVTTSSIGNSLETRYKYAKDYVPISGDAVESMADYSWNMVGIPIEQIQKVDDQVVTASATDFEISRAYEDGILVNEFIAPREIYQYETDVPGVGFSESTDGKAFSSYTKKATIHRYDERGNILEISKEGDILISYLWGYEGQYPVAMLENVSYSSIPVSSIENIKANSELDDDHCQGESGCDEANLRNALNGLRDLLGLSKALITTFTYDPLIGITSQTDPNGKTTYFGYDDFGRLEKMLDANGHVLQLYQYNYRE